MITNQFQHNKHANRDHLNLKRSSQPENVEYSMQQECDLSLL